MPFLRAALSGASRSLSVQSGASRRAADLIGHAGGRHGLTQDSPTAYDSTFLSGSLTESLRAGSRPSCSRISSSIPLPSTSA